jgi:predicted unusual protein kinase regulating ubiquinone biosynthesis (AarF/ABC1/UbiB family)
LNACWPPNGAWDGASSSDHFRPSPSPLPPSGKSIARSCPKVQYPGIAKSIDADVDNVASLLRMTGLMPATLDITPLLAEAKRQLHEEADYVREAEMMRRYHALLADDPTFLVPQPHDPLCGRSVLAMDFIDARPIELLASAPQDVRNRAMGALLGLALRELFGFGFMQTDPNFANFRWRPDEQRIVVLDFGAARPVPAGTAHAYRGLMRAGLAEDRAALREALLDVGFVSPAQLDRHGPAMDRAIDVLIGHIGRPGLFDFADRSFVEHVRAEAEVIAADRASWHIPPVDTLFVQRKVSGTALLAIRMNAQLPLREMVADAIGESLPAPAPTS